ncbi:ACR3 family arsenite efflux pump ArsB [Desulfohalotomaculum tongense]|uniref:arsenic resistance protein n=1 Tax=Desulforadius tongensis TaxID=1216062 RepID=UPI001957B65C|nr:bile acid:sodium symporter [Desulforadius tongensis]MBM7855527.1 ACR3 family arsenite efflux pump ArsB [Desulforadius tongensis]
MFFTAARFINKYVVQILLAVILFSITFGYYYPQVGHSLQPFAPLCLFSMLVPMMVGIRLDELATAAKRIKLLGVTLVINFLFSPLLAGILAQHFLSNYPDFAAGLILMGTVPCAGMIVAWTGLSRGNVSIAIVTLVISLLAGILLIPLWTLLLAGQYVSVNPLTMLKNVLIIIAIPLAVGSFIRIQLTKRLGLKKFNEVKMALPAVSSLSMYMLFFISLTAEATELIKHPDYLLSMAVPSLLFYPTLFLLAALISWFRKLCYEDMVAVSYSVAGKNIALTLALAILFFSPKTVMIVAIMPMVQVTYMATFYKLSPVIQNLWPYKTGAQNISSSP